MSLPSRDPNSNKYRDRVFYAGQWRTSEQLEMYRLTQNKYNNSEKGKARKKRYTSSDQGRQATRKKNARNNPRQVRISAGGIRFYIGVAPTVEAAESLRKKIKEEAPT